MNKWLYLGHVYHRRESVAEHHFNNRIFFIRFPLSQIAKLKKPLFSLDRWNVLSFYRKDHGNRDGSDLWSWAISKLEQAGIQEPISEIELQTFPRVFGFVFNPVSFWFCYSGAEVAAVIAEVNNTFGGTHSYVLAKGDEIQKKVFHVSPFFKVNGEYRFSFTKQEDRCAASINYWRDHKPLLEARIHGKATDWTTVNLFWTWLSHPLMTFAVVFLIHWHALLLYFKKVPFFGKNGTEEVFK
ncbi:MAG: DUF1365 domain-containing protein [Bdellovibrionaceae bacterium]|nr:DUF1365 domain-containing protein [Pseudobdellovibrionaceae bacterium]